MILHSQRLQVPMRTRVRKAASVGIFFLLALSVATGVVTNSTSWASGVSVSDDAQMMAEQAFSYPLAFDASIQNSVLELQSAGAGNASSTFYASYVTATKEYGTALLSAAQTYSQNYAVNPAQAKNTYIDDFGHARATYFGALESARNTVVSEVSGNDTARNMFVNEYNAARDIYNNQLESVKNQIASLKD